MTHTQDPVGRLRLNRAIYADKKDPLYYAYILCSDSSYVGDINSAIIEAFQLIHTPLGLYKYGSIEEATRLATQSVSILQGHINYLTETVGLIPRQTNQFNSYSLSPAPTIEPQNVTSDNVTSDNDIPLSETEQIGVQLFNSFNID